MEEDSRQRKPSSAVGQRTLSRHHNELLLLTGGDLVGQLIYSLPRLLDELPTQLRSVAELLGERFGVRLHEQLSPELAALIQLQTGMSDAQYTLAGAQLRRPVPHAAPRAAGAAGLHVSSGRGRGWMTA